MRMPNFLIIGANKGGTTALVHHLKEHPQVFISAIKEPMFFVLEGQQFLGNRPLLKHPITSLEEYQKLFANSEGYRAVGEASTAYLGNARAPLRIKHYVPDVKLIAIIRNPCDRAFSNYVYHRQQGVETRRDFHRIVKEEIGRMQKAPQTPAAWHAGHFYGYVRLGLYGDQLERYFKVFDRRQLRVYLYEEWRHEARRVMQDICRFLEIDDTFQPPTFKEVNVSQLIRWTRLDQLVNGSFFRRVLPAGIRHNVTSYVNSWNRYRPLLDPRTRRRLIAFYRPDIMKMQSLLGRDLTHWLEEPHLTPKGTRVPAMAG